MKRLFALTLLSLAACSTTPEPSWTPAEVAPPEWAASNAESGVTAVSAPEEPAPVEELPADVQEVPLSISDAVVIAFDNNRTIDVAELNPQIASFAIAEARSEFDPAVAASMRSGENAQRVANSARGGGIPTLGGGTDGGGADDPTIVDVLEGINTLASQLQPETITSRTNTVTSDVLLTQRFPTGTQVSLSADYAGTRNNLADSAYEGGWNLEVSQALLRGRGRDVNLITLRQAENTAAINEHAWRAQVMDVVQQVELTYWELVQAQEVLAINEFAVELAAEQMRLNSDMLSVGRGIEADLLSATAEHASRRAAVSTARAQVQDRNLALIRLLNPEASDQWDIRFLPSTEISSPPVPVQSDESVELALAYRPELAQARLDLSNAELGVRRAANELLPRLDLVGSYGRVRTGDSRGRAFSLFGDEDDTASAVGVEFESSIFRRGEKARYQTSRLQQTQGERIILDTEQQVETEVRQAIAALAGQWATIAPTQEAMAARTSELETAQSRYTAGRFTNLEVLIVQRDLIQAHVDEVAARVGYLQALTNLYAAEGTLLERRGIKMEKLGAMKGPQMKLEPQSA